MSSQVEWSVRSKIADLQVFLTSDSCSPEALAEIDHHLDSAVAVIAEAKEKKEVGGKT